MFTFNLKLGAILNNDMQAFCTAYSGAPGYIDNPADENLKDKGPIPEGIYYMREVIDSPTHGPFCIVLEPDPANEMYHRGGFMWHGDKIGHPFCASQGCIVSAPKPRHEAYKYGEIIKVISGEENSIAEGAD